MGRKLEKGKSGEAVQYYSRKQAMRQLQIGLPNFNRLCMWKGIHPSQPTNVRKVSKGDSRQKIYYKRKDIGLLMREPVLETLRQIRAHHVKEKKAKERKDGDKVSRLQKNRPRYELHKLIRETYPTIEDALGNMDDCLNSVFIFATLRKMSHFKHAFTALCRRRKLEFLNFCIYKQLLRRCFISVKGFYMEVELSAGERAVWLVPHQNVVMALPESSDYRMLANQMEFDIALLGAVMHSLYTRAGLSYPPKFELPDPAEGCELSDSAALAAMVCPLASNEKDMKEDLERVATFSHMDEELAAAAPEVQRRAALHALFKGQRVFLNREVPREVFCFVLRSCGAEVSWDAAGGVGEAAPFAESDESVTLQVVDRPMEPAAMRVARSYVQPQWVFDCVNAARLLPVKDYMPGATLIAHLCPFVDYSKGHVPHEYLYLTNKIEASTILAGKASLAPGTEADSEDEEQQHEQEQEGVFDPDCEMEGASEDEDEEDSDEDEDDEEDEDMASLNEQEEEVAPEPVVAKKKPVQKKSAPRRPKEEVHREAREAKELHLKEMALPKKRMNLYKKMKHAEKSQKREVIKLSEKRSAADAKKRKELSKSKQ